MIIISFAIITLMLFVFLVYYSRLHILLKLVTLPLAITLSGLVTYHYIDNLGKPLDRPIPDVMEYVHHEINGNLVYVWLTTEERGHRLHVVPYDREQTKALEEAKEKKEQSQGMAVEVTKSDIKGEGDSKPTYDIVVKNPVNGQGESK